MATNRNPPATDFARWRQAIIISAAAAGLGVLVFLVTRHRESAPPSSEIHRSKLEWRAGRWYQPGQTNGFTGVLLDTYDDGTKKARSTVTHGELEGRSEGWYTNGQLQVVEYFVAGISHGVRSKWHPNGQRLSEVTIVNGKLEGRFRRWHEDGTLAEEVELADGKPEGISRAYYPSGFVKTEARLRAGQLIEQKSWPDGEISR